VLGSVETTEPRHSPEVQVALALLSVALEDEFAALVASIMEVDEQVSLTSDVLVKCRQVLLNRPNQARTARLEEQQLERRLHAHQFLEIV
jgi:hypothetical protein